MPCAKPAICCLRPMDAGSLPPHLHAALGEARCLEQVDNEWRLRPGAPLAEVALGLPDSIHGIVLSRLDRLPEETKLTIKVASVIGRSFYLDVLASAHPEEPGQQALTKQVALLAHTRLCQSCKS